MQKDKIERGDLCKDVITGFEGIALTTCTNLHNCDTVGLHPQEVKDGKPADGFNFDVPQVIILEKGKLTPMEADPLTVDLGAEVEDTMSSYKGVVTGIATFFNGCVRVGVQCSELHEGKPIDREWFPMQQLKVVTPPQVATPTRTGGPMDMARKMSGPR